jgi:uncharacterized membrane protein
VEIAPSRRRLAVVASLALLTAFAVVMIVARSVYTGESTYANLVWNLTLAWVPLVLALLVYDAARRGAARWLIWAGALAWLLFFPNAPYLLTDFIHLGEGPAPLWYDALMLSAFAWTGLVLGFASLYLVQMIARRAFGGTVAWIAVLAALGLASVGVYVGRFLRFNSWDALLHPVRVADVLGDQLSSVPARMAEALLALVAFLFVGYLAAYSVTGLDLDLERDNEA